VLSKRKLLEPQDCITNVINPYTWLMAYSDVTFFSLLQNISVAMDYLCQDPLTENYWLHSKSDVNFQVVLTWNQRERNHLIQYLPVVYSFILISSLLLHYNSQIYATLRFLSVWKRFCFYHVWWCVSWRQFVIEISEECWRPYFWYRCKLLPVCYTCRCSYLFLQIPSLGF
jgi:hypothetical protein